MKMARAKANERTHLLQGTKAATNVSPKEFSLHRRIIIVTALSLAQLVFSFDQTAITSVLPKVAKDLHVGSSYSWIGACFFITSTSVQLINGRLSDIFGQKRLMIASLLIMGLGNLCSGLIQKPWQLYTTRAVTGFGSGSINALIQVIITDTVPLKQRGYYDGILAVLGNAGGILGPLTGGLVVDHTSWRLLFGLLSVMIGLALVLLVLTLPSSGTGDHTWSKFRSLDWKGLFAQVLWITLVLLPLSEGGTSIPWDSPMTMAMLAAGFIVCLAFVKIELSAKNPVVPVKLFSKSLSVNLLLAHYFIFGWIFWVNLFYIPFYFINVLQWDAAKAGLFVVPRLASQLVFSLLSGIYISHTDGYRSTLVVGAIIWMIASVWKSFFALDTAPWVFVAQGILEGFSQGCSSLPALIGLLALCDKEDRAIIPGLRSFFRTLGGAIGTTVSGALLYNMKAAFHHSSLRTIAEHPSEVLKHCSKGECDDSAIDPQLYMPGIRAVFISTIPLTAIYFVTLFYVNGRQLTQADNERSDALEDSHSLPNPGNDEEASLHENR